MTFSTTQFKPPTTITLGIFAHVDAGKTSITEQLLYCAGAIRAAGTVDQGNTHTDTLALERERGISIMAAPISFEYRGIKFNLIDTPGHTDFVAEVERSMAVLDGAILVISAKEGVQSHTRLLFSTLQRLGIPTIIFVNKIDRMGVDLDALMAQVRSELTPDVLPLQAVTNAGSCDCTLSTLFDESYHVLEEARWQVAENLIALSQSLIETLSPQLQQQLIEAQLSDSLLPWLKSRTEQGMIHPLLFGSAKLGLGIEACLEALSQLLPSFSLNPFNAAAPLGYAFKVLRPHAKTREVFIKLYQGSIGIREALAGCCVTRIEALHQGERVVVDRLYAGDMGIISGLSTLRVGDLCDAHQVLSPDVLQQQPLPKPTSALRTPLLSVRLMPAKPSERVALLDALGRLADQDPYLCYTLSPHDPGIQLQLFGVVQLEILTETLLREAQLEIHCDAPQPLYAETPLLATAVEIPIYKRYSFAAGVGVRIEPLPLGSGLIIDSEVSLGDLRQTFQNGALEGLRSYLDQGLIGWPITDARILFTHSGFDSVSSTPKDFRDLAPLAVFEALKHSGTQLLWPMQRFELIVPEQAMSRAIADLAAMQSDYQVVGPGRLSGRVPIATSLNYAQHVQHFTEGQGLWATTFDGYAPAPTAHVAERPYYSVHPTATQAYLKAKGAIAYGRHEV